jgi:pyruvate dehydrogenase E1 component alpha subunit
VLLELLTYRRTGHSRRDPCHYQPQDEREAWFSRDPLDRFATRLLQHGDITSSDLEAVRTRVGKSIDEAVEQAKQAPLPGADEVTTDVFV